MSFDLTRISPLGVSTKGLSDQIQIGDLTGDGIDDVVLLERAFAAQPTFTVVRQCTSREACGSFEGTGVK